MKTRYSKTNGTFYPLDIDYGKSLPTDVQLVESADYEQAMARPTGSSFAFSAAGVLSITAAPAPTPDQLKAPVLARFRADRDQLINRLVGIERAKVASNALDVATYTTSFIAMRQGLLDLPADPTVLAATDAASCAAAIKVKYDALVAGQPAAVVQAFNAYNR
jgi:hypothetical protein